MTVPRVFFLLALLLFGVIGVAALVKKTRGVPRESPLGVPLELSLNRELPPVPSQPAAGGEVNFQGIRPPLAEGELPDADRIEELFNKDEPRLPIVETLTYKSHVPWQKGRPAWLSDYAAHYETSRHFIARSLNGKPDYLKQELAEGDRFNVLRQDKNFEFHLVVDTSRCRMWFYYRELDENKKTLLKSYPVGLGRLDPSKASGLLTPLGTYQLGDRIAIYKPKMMGMRHGKKIEMITVFGTRWIPFQKEMGPCTAPAKGFGIHGTPWVMGADGQLSDGAAGIGKYESDGCIRMATPDLEELFAIIITRPTWIEIVRDVRESSLMDKKE